MTAARLSENLSVRVAPVEAGGPPPAAVASPQLNPETDWMFTSDPGGAGRGLVENRMMVPRGRKLGGSSYLDHLAWLGDVPSDELLEDLVRHYALTVHHATSTCRMSSVVDPDLRVRGVERLRVADAGVMPDVTSGHTDAPTIMMGEKAAELIAAVHGENLAETVEGPIRVPS